MPAAERAEAVAPRWSPSAPVAPVTVAKRGSAAAVISSALLPSTWSALRPVATPLAVVVNGAAVAGPVMAPTSVPLLLLNSNARPGGRLLARTQGSLPFGVPPAPERQPYTAPPPLLDLLDWRGALGGGGEERGGGERG